MAPRTLIDRGSPTVVPDSAPPRARLPSRLRLLILLVLNLGLHSALSTGASNLLGNTELGAISKRPDEDDLVTPAARLAYKVVVVLLGWRLNYDFIDISALTAITNAPFAYLLITYYDITPITAFTLAFNEIVAIAVPTYLLRPRSAVNNEKAPVRNRYLLNSFQVTVSNILLAVGVYVVVLFSAITTSQLTLFLITHFDLPTLEAVHAETPWTLIGKVVIAGFATKTFLLNPSIAETPVPGDVTPVEPFDAATADLPQTVKQNFWFFTRRTRTLIQRTGIASAFLFANTVRRCLSLEGTDFVGAAGYSSVWILANILCAAWWVWVGDANA